MARSSLAGDGMFVGALVSGRLGAACSGAVGSRVGRREGSRRGRRAGVSSLVDWLAPAIWGVWALGGVLLLAVGGSLSALILVINRPRPSPAMA